MAQRVDPISKANHYAALVAAACTLAMVFSVVYEVVARYVFNNPTRWSLEVSQDLLVYVSFLGFGYAMREEAMVRVDIILRTLPRRAVYAVEILASIAAIVFLCILAWQAGLQTRLAFVEKWRSDSPIAIPLFPIYIVMPIGAVAILLQTIVRLITFTKKLWKGE